MKYGYGFRQTRAEGQAEVTRGRSGNRCETGRASKEIQNQGLQRGVMGRMTEHSNSCSSRHNSLVPPVEYNPDSCTIKCRTGGREEILQLWGTEQALSAEVLARGDRVGLSCSENVHKEEN